MSDKICTYCGKAGHRASQCPMRLADATRESAVESYLKVKALEAGAAVRKVNWVGRRNAPDRVVMHPALGTLWVEVKNPSTIKTFPANAHERAQAREHEYLRAHGQWVEVVGTKAQVDAIFAMADVA
jgi:hypothetical protein